MRELSENALDSREMRETWQVWSTTKLAVLSNMMEKSHQVQHSYDHRKFIFKYTKCHRMLLITNTRLSKIFFELQYLVTT